MYKNAAFAQLSYQKPLKSVTVFMFSSLPVNFDILMTDTSSHISVLICYLVFTNNYFE